MRFAEALIAAGEDVNRPTARVAATALHAVCSATGVQREEFNAQTAMVVHLVRPGADFNAVTKIGATPIHYACTNGHDAFVDVLLNAGAGLNDRDNDGDR